jgi:hypothetical protein
MTPLEMQVGFEIEVGSIDSTLKPLTTDIFYWLNQAIIKFVKTRYSGINFKGESFESSQKRIDDLRTLVTEVALTPVVGINKPNCWIAIIPSDYMFTVGEEVTISYVNSNNDTISLREGVTETTNNTYRQEIDNPFSGYILLYGEAQPLRLYYSTYVELITDGNYDITMYYLRYISQPNVISLTSSSSNLPSITHTEIVKLAVSMYLENIKNPRYQSYLNEINTME